MEGKGKPMSEAMVYTIAAGIALLPVGVAWLLLLPLAFKMYANAVRNVIRQAWKTGVQVSAGAN